MDSSYTRNIIILLLSVTFGLWANIAFSQSTEQVYLDSAYSYTATGGTGWSYNWTLTDPDDIQTTLSSTETFNLSQSEEITFAKLGFYTLTLQAVNDFGCLTEVYNKLIDVIEIPNEPPNAIDDSFSSIENTVITGNVLDNDSDQDGDPLTITEVAFVSGTEGTLNWTADGNFTFTPPTDFFGTITYKYSVCDDFDPPACDTATITFSYSGNTSPTANNDAFTTNQDTPLTADVMGNDSDVDGDQLNTTAQLKSTSNGSVSIGTNGTFTYTPNPGFFGTDEFTYELCDDGIPGKCSFGTVTITVLEVVTFDRVAINDIAFVFENNLLTAEVLNNDINFSGNGISVSVPSGSETINGALAMNANGSYNYQPNAAFIGVDNFYYRACADQEPVGCDEANVTIRVLPEEITTINLVLNDDEAETAVNIPVAGNVLLNDFSPVNEVLLVSKTPVQPPAHGQVTIDDDGVYQYIPESGYVGDDSFVYRACGLVSGDCQTARVTIRVNAEVEASVFAVDDVYQIFSTETATGNLLDNDIIPDGKTLTANTTPIKQPVKGSVSIASNGTFTYTPGSTNYPFVDQFVYEACDQDGNCTRANVYVVVSEQPDEFADISVVKTGPAEAVPGNLITYEITVSNSGNLMAENILLDDFLPAFVLSPQYTINGVEPASSWMGQINLGSLADGESIQVSISGMIADNVTNVLENYASVLSDQYDPDLSNNYSTVQTNINRSPIIVVENGLLQIVACCDDSGLQLDASESIGFGELTYLWEPATGLDNPNSATPIFIGTTTTQYTLTVTSENGAYSTETVLIEIAPCPEIVLDEQVFVNSANENVMLDASGSTGSGLTYAWWTAGNELIVSGQTTGTPIVSGLGKYYLQITDEFGCTDLDSISVGLLVQLQAVDDSANVLVNTSIDINVLSNDIPKDGIDPATVAIIAPPEHGVAVVTADSIITYTPNQYYTGSDDFMYTVCDFLNHCDDATVLVIVSDETLFVPNAFSPNGDGYNDLYEIKGINQYPEVSLKVFNRWGNLVYESNNYGEGVGRDGFWDGIANRGVITGGGHVPTGTYYYILDLGYGNEKLSGFIYLDR